MIKVLFDTNVLVSAAYSRESVPYMAFKKATEPPYQALICEINLEEFYRIYERKFPHKAQQFEQFIAVILAKVEVVPVPLSPYPDEDNIRDVDDRPILRAAIKAGVDILLTGDKDFFKSTVTNPKIMTATQFVQMDILDG